MVEGNIHQQAAQQFMGLAESFLAQALGRDLEVKDLATFVETAGAGLIGSMYAILRDQEGKEKSEAWLKKALNSVSAMARLSGADAMLSFDVKVKDVPNRMAKKDRLQEIPQVKTDPVAQTDPTCECVKDEDGGCQECEKSTSAFLMDLFKHLFAMTKAGKEGDKICVICKANCADKVISSMIPEVVKPFMAVEMSTQERLEKVATLVLQLGMTVGVQAMPLSQEALKAFAPVEG